jgi:hypothetical protein
VKWCEVRWSKVKIFGGICPLSRIYYYVVCMCFPLQYVFLLSNCLRAICFMSLVVWRVPINYFFSVRLALCFVCSVSFNCFVMFFPMYIVVYLLFVYKFTDHCHQIETELQLRNIASYHIISYHIMYCTESCLICRKV